MEKFLKPKFKKITSQKISSLNEQLYTIEKLERGFGNTIGNSLRRVLLSSIPGLAMFAIKINGVSHEFQGIKGVEEDMVEFILNIKEILFEVDENQINIEEVIELGLISKKGEVKAGDIKLPAGVKIVNPDYVIANTNADGLLKVSFYCIYSKGYKTFDENKEVMTKMVGDVNDLIAIDSNFSPIEKVNIKVIEVNPGESRVFERLELYVTTKGNIKADKAIAIAAKIIRNYFLTFEELEEVDLDFEDEKPEEIENTQLSIQIELLNLSSRSENALLSSNIKTVEDLVSLTISELKGIVNLGAKSIKEILHIVKDMGLSFKSE